MTAWGGEKIRSLVNRVLGLTLTFQIHTTRRSEFKGSEGSTSLRMTEILLVDDNLADTDLTSEVLAHSGCPVTSTLWRTGVEATAFLSREGKYASSRLRDS